MKAAWQGYIALGQLGIPVRLYTATKSLRPRFVQLHEKDGSPVRRQLQCREEQRDISSSEIIRAVEYEPGHYITLTNHELEQTAINPIKTIAINQFCTLGEISPLYFEKPYFIVPSRGGERAYGLLREVLVRVEKIAIAQFVIQNRERIAAIITHGDLLLLHQLHFAAEILPRESLKTPPLPKPSPSEIEALSTVVERFSGPFYITDYHDEHAERINELIERKAKGLPPAHNERIAPHATPEDEIINVLQDVLSEPKRILSD